MLAYLDTARHFDGVKELNVGDREVLVFWDYPCLYQKGDSSTNGVTLSQLDSFQRGLASINVLYGHVATLCLLCTKNYPVVVRTGYRDSAWPYFEMLVSTLIKNQDMAVDLPEALDWIRRVGNSGTTERNRSIYWLYEHVRRAHRRLPVLPSTFDSEIINKVATNGSDVTFLKKKYRQTFESVMEPAQQMELMDIPCATPHEWKLLLTTTLQACPRLVLVNLAFNEAIKSATLEPFASLHASLQHLNVSMCAGFSGSLEALRGLRKLRYLILCGCLALEGSVEPLSALQELAVLDVEACFGLVGGLMFLSPLEKLKILNVCDTRLNTGAFIAERRRVVWDPTAAREEERGAVVVGGCRVGRYWNDDAALECR